MSHKGKKRAGLRLALILLILAFALGAGAMVWLSITLAQPPETAELSSEPLSLPSDPDMEAPQPSSEPSAGPSSEPEPETVIATASLSAQGDMLMHLPLFDSASAVKQADGSYDFSSHFTYLTPCLDRYDWSIANLETTFGGDGHTYQGWPLFNCRDELAPALKAAGYDMLTLANNHSYDTLMDGLLRTQQVTREAGLETLGTRQSSQEKRYAIQEINGIRIGLICYTYTTSLSDSGRPRLNGNAPVEQPELINYFSVTRLDSFYTEVEELLAAMEAEGTDAVILYIHWGYEYKLTEDASQNKIAQALCDRGIDVILGDHPHVVQPVELLTSATDPEHRTVCVYSLGNAVSNQRREKMNLNTGQTEDGLLFGVTFEKYSDGQVYLASVEAIPTWVNLHRKNGGNEYNILPLEDAARDSWQETMDLTDQELAHCEASYDRTMQIIGQGLDQVNAWLEQAKKDRERDYLSRAEQ